MAQLKIKLETLKVHEKNEWSKDEAYLWCFGLVVDANTIRNGNYIVKKKPDQGNLGKGLKKGDSRQIPNDVGYITTSINPIKISDKNMALVGIVMLAWEEDRTPNSKVIEAYDDSVTILEQYITDRVGSLNTDSLTQTEIDTIKSNLNKAIKKRFKSAVHWYNPFSWDPDDFIGFAQIVEVVEAGQPLTKQIDFTFTGDDAKYQAKGQLEFVP